MATQQVFLSLFPGIDTLGMAFKEVFPEACIVHGPDKLWGWDVKDFHVPPRVFTGIFGGPPCQQFSRMANVARARGQTIAPNLIPEFERCVGEGQPQWFLMENVPDAPIPSVAGYVVHDYILNNRWVGGIQRRVRRFSFGTREGLRLSIEEIPLEAMDYMPAVTARGTVWDKATQRPVSRRTAADFRRACIGQGLPEDFLEGAPFTAEGKMKLVGNGVPRETGLAIAKAVKRALNIEA